MKREAFRHGFPAAAWEAAKEEARELMISCARRGRDITYSDLVSKIRHVTMEPHDPRLAHFLGEIAEEEDAAGRGLLTVVVVHKHGDKMPGPGFFELAKTRGRDVSDKELVWIAEARKVQEVWSRE